MPNTQLARIPRQKSLDQSVMKTATNWFRQRLDPALDNQQG